MAGVTRRRRQTTLQDLADVVGLTANTVSRALNDRSGVRPATRALIKAEAERLGYVPNIHARSLVLGSRKTIGVILPDAASSNRWESADRKYLNEAITAAEAQAVAA